MSTASGVRIKIGGQDRLLKFTHTAAAKLERILPKQNLYSTITEGTLPLSVEAYALMFALEGGGAKGLKIDVVQKWRDKFVDENDSFTLNAKLIEALFLSGIFGKKSRFAELMTGETNEDEDADEGKNG